MYKPNTCLFGTQKLWGPSLSWSYGSWIYNYLWNQCLSPLMLCGLLPLMLWVWIPINMRCTTLFDKVCQWLTTGWWFSQSPPVSSTNKTDCHNITEILLKVALNTIKPNQTTKVISKEIHLRQVSFYILERKKCL